VGCRFFASMVGPANPAGRPATGTAPAGWAWSGTAGRMQVADSANTLGRLGSIQAKTLVLTGTGDRLIDPSARGCWPAGCRRRSW
jgi:hypothetical protein